MSELPAWGPVHDPDIQLGMLAYEDSGLTLQDPTDIRGLDNEDMHELAESCGELLQEVYDNNYPLGAGEAAKLVEDVRSERTHLFTLSYDERLIAMSAIVKHDNRLGGDVSFAELGRSVSRADDDVDVSMRPLLKNRVPWGIENTEADFLFSVTRTAGEYEDGIPSGKGVQSVWWGGRAHGAQLPFVTTSGGWEYKLRGLEPFNGFAIPTDPEAWVQATQEHPVYVPSDEDKAGLDTLLGEGTNGRVMPLTRVSASTHEVPVPLTFAQTAGPSDVMTAKYVITDTPHELRTHKDSEVDDQLSESVSQKVVVEADIVARPEGANVMQALKEQGWTLTGWQPSEISYGGICPVFARLNPDMADIAVQPAMHESYFDNGGLADTRRFLEKAYADMYAAARQAA